MRTETGLWDALWRKSSKSPKQTLTSVTQSVAAIAETKNLESPDFRPDVA